MAMKYEEPIHLPNNEFTLIEKQLYTSNTFSNAEYQLIQHYISDNDILIKGVSGTDSTRNYEVYVTHEHKADEFADYMLDLLKQYDLSKTINVLVVSPENPELIYYSATRSHLQ